MKWYLSNFSRRLQFGLRNPIYAFKTALRELTFADERFLASATGARASEIRRYLNEPILQPDFLDLLRRCEKTFHSVDLVSADLYAKKVLLQYAAIRATRPQIIVETGVANGVSTSYLLLALKLNGGGRLHSIEVGDNSYLPTGFAPGWIVPDFLRPLWQLHLGDAKVLLPDLLRQLGSIDVFIHDSLHTYEHMKFELQTAYPHVKSGGLLLADDALWNSAFHDFARGVKAPAARILRGVGFMRK
jgi:predicted O-methyltransferase YrrM